MGVFGKKCKYTGDYVETLVLTGNMDDVIVSNSWGFCNPSTLLYCNVSWEGTKGSQRPPKKHKWGGGFGSKWKQINHLFQILSFIHGFIHGFSLEIIAPCIFPSKSKIIGI